MAAPDDAKPDLIAGLQQLPMRHRWLRWAVLSASLAFSAAGTYYFGSQVRQEAHSRFETVAVGVARDVQSRIRAYGDVLYAIRGLFDSSDTVTRDEFHQFAQALSLAERYPGATNVSFAPRVLHAKKLEFERAVRAEKSPLVDAALRRAAQMREEVAKLELRSDDRPLGPVTVSLGVAAFPDHAKESGELLRCADEALYLAKQTGRNRVVAYSADLQKAGVREGA